MNERIRELAEQVGYMSTRWDTTEQFEQFLDEFAQSIVRECANIDFRFKVGMTTDQESDTGRVILEHFDLK